MEQTNSSPSSEEAASELDSDPNWTRVSYENWPSDFVPGENGQRKHGEMENLGRENKSSRIFKANLKNRVTREKRGRTGFSSTQKRLKPSGKNLRKSTVFRRQNQKPESPCAKAKGPSVGRWARGPCLPPPRLKK